MGTSSHLSLLNKPGILQADCIVYLLQVTKCLVSVKVIIVVPQKYLSKQIISDLENFYGIWQHNLVHLHLNANIYKTK